MSTTTTTQLDVSTRISAAWSSTWSGYSLRTGGDKGRLWRRLAVIWILFLRTGLCIVDVAFTARRLSLWRHYFYYGSYEFGLQVFSLVVYIIASIIAFFFVAHSLAKMGEMSGERKVFGAIWGRRAFDWWLGWFAFAHAGLVVIWVFLSIYSIPEVLWVLFWLWIALIGWIAGPSPSPMANAKSVDNGEDAV